MDDGIRESLWRQFGAAIDMLERAVTACPEELWERRGVEPEFWYLAYHTTFWLDAYLSGDFEGFAPPPPFGLEEFDPAGIMPPRVYTKAELLGYLAHCRDKCRAAVARLDDGSPRRLRSFRWGEASEVELLIYNLRHVQHGAAQLNLLLRQEVDAAPRWVARTKTGSFLE